MEQQTANIVKICYYQIRNIGRISTNLTNQSRKILVHALVTSRLDCGNSILYAQPNNTMKGLLNCAGKNNDYHDSAYSGISSKALLSIEDHTYL